MEELNMSRQCTKQFKDDAVKYFLSHKELGLVVCAKNLGISRTALSGWNKNARENNGEVSTRGSGNFESDEVKENVRLRKELRDKTDALEILKKAIGILGN